MYLIGYPLFAIVQILHSLLFLYTLVIIASAVISWIDADPRNRIVQLINQLVNPYYYWINKHLGRFIPRPTGLNLTPLVALLLIQFVKIGILPSFSKLAMLLTQ